LNNTTNDKAQGIQGVAKHNLARALQGNRLFFTTSSLYCYYAKEVVVFMNNITKTYYV
jgi:hypothetical protein